MKKSLTTFLLLAGLLLTSGVVQQTKAQSDTKEDDVVNIIEYSDYQCPACAAYHPVIQKIKEKYGDRLEIEYKFYPLNSHQYAALAARAAQAAKNQDKFLQMHNLLFENQKQWSESGNPTPVFVNFARELDLDIERFKNDLNSAETQKMVMEEKQTGRQKGVSATPTFIIEGDVIDPLPRSYAEFDQVVQKYLNKKEDSEKRR